METQRLSASHVQLGEPLPGDVYDDTGHMLLSAGFVITDPALLETLLERGMYVDIHTFNAFYGGTAEPAAAAPEKTFDPFGLRDSLKKRLNRLLRSLRQTNDAAEQFGALAAAVHELAAGDAEGAIAAGILDDEAYAIRHSVFSAILCDLTAATLGWPDARRTGVVCAALSMNAAMLDLQDKLLNQGTPLTPQQLDTVRVHPGAACDLLRGAGVADEEWLAAVMQHHEHAGGNGYPAHVAQPDEASQLLRIVDVFGALLAPRADRKPQTPPQAVRALYAQESGGPYAALAGALVKVLGFFPPGSFVRLANNETAVVHRHGGATGTPLVASITSGTGNRYMKPVARDTAHKEFTIAGLLPRDKVAVGYDLATLWVKRL